MLAAWHNAWMSSLFAPPLNIDSIAVRVRRRDHKKRNRVLRLVHELVRHTRRYFDALARIKLNARTLNLQHRSTLQNVKELTRARVKVPAFAVSRRYAFLNDA